MPVDDENLRLARESSNFARLLGVTIVEEDPERLVGQLKVTQSLLNRNGTLHGGAVMALADHLGGTATFLNLGKGQGTATSESKTNFFRPVPAGDTVTTVTTPLHRGRRTMVWETRITRSDGKLAAIVTQTQMVLQDDQ